MPSLSPCPDPTPVVHKVRSVAKCHNQQKHCPSVSTQLPTSKRWVSIVAGNTDHSQGGSSGASTILGQNTTPGHVETIETDATSHILCHPASSIACNSTPLSGLENLLTHIPNSEARAIFHNLLGTRATETNHSHTQCQLQQQAVSTS